MLDPEGNHWVLPGIRGGTRLSNNIDISMGIVEYENQPINLCSSFLFYEDPEKDEYTPPYPLEDDMHATLKKQWH